jgi:GABA(A) receptor-associated protein
MSSYTNSSVIEERLIESNRIKQKFPGRIPVIVERCKNNKLIPDIDKNKFLVPGDLNVAQFIYIIRKRLSLPSEVALFFFIKGILPTTGTLMKELYSIYKDSDGFLYAQYSGENTFG